MDYMFFFGTIEAIIMLLVIVIALIFIIRVLVNYYEFSKKTKSIKALSQELLTIQNMIKMGSYEMAWLKYYKASKDEYLSYLDFSSLEVYYNITTKFRLVIKL